MISAKLVKKLRLKKGCDYILFFDETQISQSQIEKLIFELRVRGYGDSLAVMTVGEAKIKLMELEKSK